MGYNTIALFSNDAYDQFKKHPEKTVNNILDGMDGGRQSYKGSYGVGNHANPMKVQNPRHSSDDSIYIHSGNTLCEMRTYSNETENLMENHPEFFERMLSRMESEAKRLRKEFNERRKEKTSD